MVTHPRIVILTGAGISAESGLQTFRAMDGLWNGHRVEDVATPEGFAHNPTLVHEFYNKRRADLKTVMPNAAHLALAKLGREWPGEVLLVTQNVDDLHERASDGKPMPNTYRLLHMHGMLKKARCSDSGEIYPWHDDILVTTDCPSCGARVCLRPHIVWFGEMPLYLDEIDAALNRCDLFLSIGTSGNVYPAAGFVAQVAHRGRAHTVELNLEPSLGQSIFDERIYGPASEVVPAYIEKILSEGF